MMETKAVIFDNDGVLVDSLDQHWLAYCEAVGKGLDKMEILTREGMTARGIIIDLTGFEGEELEKTIKKKRIAFTELRKSLAPDPKALMVVKQLRKRGLKIGMATGTIRENVESMFGESMGLFDEIVAAGETTHAKPHPEPYLIVAKRLGVAPEECVVVENAPLGVKSAKRGGMRCIAITSTVPAEYLQEADVIINDIEEVLEWI